MMGIIRSVVKQASMQHKPILKKYSTKEDLLKFAIPIKYISKIEKLEISVVLKPINSFNIIIGNEKSHPYGIFLDQLQICAEVFPTGLASCVRSL